MGARSKNEPKALQRRAELAELEARRNRILADAGSILSESFDFDEALNGIASLIVPDLSESYQAILLEDDVPQLVAFAHVKPRSSEALRKRSPADLMKLIDGKATNGNSIVVPLIARKTRLGAMVFGKTRGDAADAKLCEEIARRAALAVDAGRLYRQAQEAIRVRDEFLSIAAHELRTPLTALQLQLQAARQLLEKLPPPDPRVTRRIERADWSMQKLARFVDELLGVSRISLGLMTIHRELFDMREAVSDVVERLAEHAQRAASTVTIRAEKPLVGRWDRLRIEQVLTNLLVNAFTFGPGKPVEIEIAKRGKSAEVVVRDHGIGIAKEDVDRIFGRFERAVSKWNHGGLGLGLYVSRQIVDAHGGLIHVESTPGKGAAFFIELPLGPDERDQPGSTFRTSKDSKRTVP